MSTTAPALKVAFATFGCKVNQYESAAIREAALAEGHAAVVDPVAADVVVVNTCTVTAEADRKGRQAVRRLHRRAPRARIVVTGCGADSAGEAYTRLPGVAAVVGNAGKGGLAALLGDAERSTLNAERRGGASTMALRLSRFPGHARAFLKIEDGCHLRCRYCIIPSVRGEVRSKPPEAVVDEAAALAAAHPEIVLTGIHLGGWGRDLVPRLHLADLLPRVARTPGLARLRLSSLEFQEVTPALIDVLATGGVHASHLHVPLQSGSDRVLRAMRRGYRRRTIARAVDALRAAVPGLGLTTDVIVGFPGESDADFDETLAVCRDLGFHKIHRFPYSRRPGTPAAALRATVPAPAVAARMQRLAEVEAEGRARHAGALVGRTVTVLIEESAADDASAGVGHTGCYARARVAGAAAPRGAMIRARVVATSPEGVVCERDR